MKKLFVTVVATTLLAACSDNSGTSEGGDPGLRPLSLTSANLAGAWEMDGSDYSRSEMRAHSRKTQLEISNNTITYITGSGFKSASAITASFYIQGTRLVTSSARQEKEMMDFEVYSLTASTLQLRPLRKNFSPDSQIWSLRRIDPSQLMIYGGSSDFTQHMELGVTTASLSFKKKYNSTSSLNLSQLTCRLSDRTHGDVLDISLVSYRHDPRGKIENTIETQVSLHGRLDSSRMTISTRNTSRSGFVARFNPPRSASLDLSLGDNGNCEIRVERQGQKLDFSGTCRGVSVFSQNSRPDYGARVNVGGSCLLK